jgi:chemotaxis protein CheX
LDAAIINQFLVSTQSVLRDYFNIHIMGSGAPRAVKSEESMEPLTVVLGFTGDLEGHLFLGYQLNVALSVARAMMGNPLYPKLDEMCVSALSELGNMVGGTTATKLAGLGYVCNLLPPAVISTGQQPPETLVPLLIRLPLDTSSGPISICVGLRPAATS